jgi:hypothetical protein
MDGPDVTTWQCQCDRPNVADAQQNLAEREELVTTQNDDTADREDRQTEPVTTTTAVTHHPAPIFPEP